MSQPDTPEIPNRSLFRQPEVCEIARIQAYVLRSWEAEFPDLGVAKTAGGPRVYRRADVERVLRIKHLLFVEGLTLAGARRKLVEEQAGRRRKRTRWRSSESCSAAMRGSGSCSSSRHCASWRRCCRVVRARRLEDEPVPAARRWQDRRGRGRRSRPESEGGRKEVKKKRQSRFGM